MSAHTILLVDDDPAHREMLRDALTFLGYQVLLAAGGVDGVRLARESHPDAVLMDLAMPDLDGVEATRRIQAEPVSAGIPVVCLTALSQPVVRDRVEGARFAAFLEKPIAPRRVAAVLKEVLSRGDG